MLSGDCASAPTYRLIRSVVPSTHKKDLFPLSVVLPLLMVVLCLQQGCVPCTKGEEKKFCLFLFLVERGEQANKLVLFKVNLQVE